MRARTAMALTAIVVALKAVLIGMAARGRCELVGSCGDGTVWYTVLGMSAVILGLLLAVTVVGARRDVVSRRR